MAVSHRDDKISFILSDYAENFSFRVFLMLRGFGEICQRVEKANMQTGSPSPHFQNKLPDAVII